jgi:hypothetical protein
MQGHNLLKVIKNDDSIREAGLFGMFGGHINCTDGRYVYMRAPSGTNSPLYEHTLMPCHMKRTFPVDELQDIVLSEPFEFTKGCRMMKIYGYPFQHKNKELLDFSTMLYDIQNDPNQQQPIKNGEVESRMCDYMISLMKQNAAPGEQYDRLGLT